MVALVAGWWHFPYRHFCRLTLSQISRLLYRTRCTGGSSRRSYRPRARRRHNLRGCRIEHHRTPRISRGIRDAQVKMGRAPSKSYPRHTLQVCQNRYRCQPRLHYGRITATHRRHGPIVKVDMFLRTVIMWNHLKAHSTTSKGRSLKRSLFLSLLHTSFLLSLWHLGLPLFLGVSFDCLLSLLI